MNNCIRNIIRIGNKTKNESSNTVEIEYLGKKQEALLFVPYGMHVKTPNSDMTALIFAQEGHEDSLIVFLSDISNIDEIDGDEGLALGIPTQKERLIFKDEAKIVFKVGDTEGGDFAVRFNELEKAFNEFKDDFNDFVNNVHNASVVPHTHSGVQPGAGSTGTATITTGTQTSADIADAKIEEIELPEK